MNEPARWHLAKLPVCGAEAGDTLCGYHGPHVTNVLRYVSCPSCKRAAAENAARVAAEERARDTMSRC